ncbi:uncharacterized protein [Glycine max]|uniref:uncharacterized protein n=1 Tax=Glycine max TaxID=3847 RepID=UPI00071914DD|nr:uncharacterized protein LOC106798053 [Glycine max]|eukprot:XP_014629082.1 uncharacterized protein LOC106798053 [Glycine max]
MADTVMDCIKAAIVELISSQLKFTAAVDTMATKLDDLLQQLALHNATQHFPSSSSEQSPPPLPLSMPTSPPCSTPMQPSASSLPAPLPMPIAPPCLAPVQPLPAPCRLRFLCLLLIFPISVIHAAISFDNLFSTILRCGHATAPHDKPWENRDMALFGTKSYGTAMVAHKCQPTAFALWTATKPGAFRRNRPWDPGITFGSHGLKPQHLEDKVFLMGLEC